MSGDMKLVLPEGSAARKSVPMARGLLDYFPAALAEVAKLSKAGNDKHNPGQELHHARGKSNDHADCIVRHLIDRGSVDPEDGIRHAVKVAWRALALLQEELEASGEAPLARGARPPVVNPLGALFDAPKLRVKPYSGKPTTKPLTAIAAEVAAEFIDYKQTENDQ